MKRIHTVHAVSALLCLRLLGGCGAQESNDASSIAAIETTATETTATEMTAVTQESGQAVSATVGAGGEKHGSAWGSHHTGNGTGSAGNGCGSGEKYGYIDNDCRGDDNH
ncbi:MAG: hypothetical protein LUC50_07630 [Ruminococcus sp.]|nr:hypothetical protein [Ruminococcus sp.]